MKNLFKKTAAGVFLAGLTFGFAPAAVAADATPACWVDSVEQAEIHYSNENGKLTQFQVERNIAEAAKDKAAADVEAAQAAADQAKADFEASKTEEAPDGDAAKKKASDDANAKLKEAQDAQASADSAYEDAEFAVKVQEGTVNNYAYPALKKIQDADPAEYNKAHGCKADPAKPDQKPGKDVKPEQKPGKDAKANDKADNTKKAPVEVKNKSKNVKGGLASTGAIAASLAGLAAASLAGGSGVVAWRRRKA